MTIFGRSKRTSKNTPQATELSPWGEEALAPDLTAIYMAEETIRIQKSDIAASFDGSGELDMTASIDMWGESVQRDSYTGVLDLVEELEEKPVAVSAIDGFHFDGEFEQEFTLAGPSSSTQIRRTSFAVVEVKEDDNKETEDIEEAAAQAVSVKRFTLSFTATANIDHVAAGLPEPIPARISV